MQHFYENLGCYASTKGSLAHWLLKKVTSNYVMILCKIKMLSANVIIPSTPHDVTIYIIIMKT